MQRIDLFLIDPQEDFCNPNGSLFVPGADDDMSKLAKMINRIQDKIYDIHVTLDSHNLLHIAHPIAWENSEGKHPDPFTSISVDDVKQKVWKATNPDLAKRALSYVEALEVNGKYGLTIWPPHCLIGSPGHNIVPEVLEAIRSWEAKYFGFARFVTKGSNFRTEHYSAAKADVPDPEDPTTSMNKQLIDMLQESDIILVAGEARSHCVANTIRDVSSEFGPEHAGKFVLLEDAMSDVPGFEDLGEAFMNDMISLGANTSTTVDFLAQCPV